MQDISRYGYGKWLNNKRQYEINMDSFLEEIRSEKNGTKSEIRKMYNTTTYYG